MPLLRSCGTPACLPLPSNHYRAESSRAATIFPSVCSASSFHEPAAKAGASSAHSKRCRARLKVTELREAFGVRPACWRFRFMVPMRDSGIVAAPHDGGVGRGSRRGAATQQRPSSPKPSPPSDGGEGEFDCGSAALRNIQPCETLLFSRLAVADLLDVHPRTAQTTAYETILLPGWTLVPCSDELRRPRPAG